MKRRLLCSWLWLWLTLLLPIAIENAHAAPPSFVVVLTDDQGYEEWQGIDPRIHTPELVRLASEGFVLHEFHAMATCSPARASLLTGRATQRHGVTRLASQRPGDLQALSPAEVTIAERLRGAGFATGLVGKWHLGRRPEAIARHGFASFYGFVQGSARYVDPVNFHRDARALGVVRGYSTDLLADEAVAFIERHREQPFFLLFAPNAPHTIALGLPRDLAHYPEAGFSTRQRHTYAALTSVDRALGRIRESLAANGLTENTLVIVTSDNGSDLLPRAKGTLYRRGSHVPFVAWGPSKIAVGSSRQLSDIADLFPTLLEWAGLERDPTRVIDGHSLASLLAGQQAPIRSIQFREWAGALAAFDGRHHLILQPDPLYRFRAELYDVKADPDETRNLMLADFSAGKPVFERLKAAIEQWQRDVRDEPDFSLADFIE